ncbi:MAG: VOC family protein [Acidobacteriota bacterium]|jgi:catechol 2,3-dioxygenase-like lactoylglutathione lyase family enzyme|nr:VOC family protein [Acidobacteriota bacterium]
MSTLSIEAFHTILLCRKWEECVAFYRDLLGFQTVDSKPGFVEVEVTPGARLGLIQRTRGLDAEDRDSALVLTFRVLDLEKAHAILASRCQGVTEIMRHPWGERLFKMRDPDGRPLEIWSQP